MITTLSGLTVSPSLLVAPDSELSVSRHCHFQSFNSTFPVLPLDIQWISPPELTYGDCSHLGGGLGSTVCTTEVHFQRRGPTLFSPVYEKYQDASVSVDAKIHMKIKVKGKRGWSHVTQSQWFCTVPSRGVETQTKENCLFLAHIWWLRLVAEPPVTVIQQNLWTQCVSYYSSGQSG